MKTIIHINTDDQARQAIACLMAGKETKRLATRQDITAIVQGLFDQVANDAAQIE